MKEQYLKNAESFVDQAIKQEKLFGLFDEKQGWANCHAHDNKDAKAVYLFWSSPTLAAKLQNQEWADYKVEAISLSVFLDSWLDGMQKKQVFAGVNWDENLYGLEIEAMVLKNSIIEKEQEISVEETAK